MGAEVRLERAKGKNDTLRFIMVTGRLPLDGHLESMGILIPRPPIAAQICTGICRWIPSVW